MINDAHPDPIPLICPVEERAFYTNAKAGGTFVKYWYFNEYMPRVIANHFGQSMRLYGPSFLSIKALTQIVGKGKNEHLRYLA